MFGHLTISRNRNILVAYGMPKMSKLAYAVQWLTLFELNVLCFMWEGALQWPGHAALYVS